MKLLLLVALGVVAAQAEQSQVLKDFSVGYTQFTADVYKELLRSNSGNFLVCPLSVDVILALVHNGAEGRTAEQISAALHLPEDKEKIKQIFTELTPYLHGDDQYTLTSANKVYLKDGFPIGDQFKKTAVDVFKSDIQNIDFEKKEEAAAEMNKWIEEQTHEKIKNVISKDDLNKYTRAVLINAMYFHGNWVTKFQESDTRKRDFHLNKQDKVQVDMMDLTESFRYYESSELDAQFVELPYEGDDITMTFVLPNDIEGLPALEARIGDVLNAPRYYYEKVHIVVPKFKIESTIQFKPLLQALGVGDAFEESANFRGLSTVPTKISKIIQKAFIEVDEEGTTAAAATVVFQELTRSALQIEFPPREFIADHPFIYYLKSPAGVMFIGRYVNNKS